MDNLRDKIKAYAEAFSLVGSYYPNLDNPDHDPSDIHEREEQAKINAELALDEVVSAIRREIAETIAKDREWPL